MKKVLCAVGEVLLGCIICPFLLIAFIVSVPVDFFKYSFSTFKKKYRWRYRLFSTLGIEFKVAEEIAKNTLPIDFICDPSKKPFLPETLFGYKNRLLITDIFHSDVTVEADGSICVIFSEESGDESCVELSEYIRETLSSVNGYYGEERYTEGVVLLNSQGIEDRESFSEEKREFF